MSGSMDEIQSSRGWSVRGEDGRECEVVIGFDGDEIGSTVKVRVVDTANDEYLDVKLTEHQWRMLVLAVDTQVGRERGRDER